MLPEPCEELPQSFIPSFCSILITTLFYDIEYQNLLVRNMFRSFSRTIMAMFDCNGWLDFMNIVYFTEHLAFSVRTNKINLWEVVPHKASIRSGTCVGSKGYSAWKRYFLHTIARPFRKHTTTKHVQRIVLELWHCKPKRLVWWPIIQETSMCNCFWNLYQKLLKVTATGEL